MMCCGWVIVIVFVVLLFVVLFVGVVVFDLFLCVVWNVSGSVLIGFYWIELLFDLLYGVFVVVMLFVLLVWWLVECGYFGECVFLLKYVVVKLGQCVCRIGVVVSVDVWLVVVVCECDGWGCLLLVW